MGVWEYGVGYSPPTCRHTPTLPYAHTPTRWARWRFRNGGCIMRGTVEVAGERTGPDRVAPWDLELFHEPEDRLRLTVGGHRSYPTVRPAWAAPLSHPDRYLVLLDGKGEEIALVEDPQELPPRSLAAVREELRRRYLTATVTAVSQARVEFGATYWSVLTDRGPRDFVTQNLQENAIWLSDHHLLLVDVDGNRFEVPNSQDLDAASQQYIGAVL